MVNAERVWQLIARIEEVEAAPGCSDGKGNWWNQSRWARPMGGPSTNDPLDLISLSGRATACGTAMCAAGWAVYEFPQESLRICRQLGDASDAVTIANVACRVLGFTYDQSLAFFSPTNSLERLIDLATEWCGPRPVAAADHNRKG